MVEAAEKGGALITVDIANSYNKDIFAFPGNIGRSFSEGCNNLIKSNSAHLISGIKDLEFIMNWDLEKPAIPKNIVQSLEGFTPDEQVIIKILRDNNNQLHVDELSWRTGIVIAKIASLLLGLELRGTIVSVPGKIYKLRLSG